MDDGAPPGGGALAAHVLERAAELIGAAAHSAAESWDDAAGAAAQAQALARRARRLAARNAVTYAAAADALGGTIASDRPATRDHLLGDALARAADAPLAIAEAAADAAALGTLVSAHAPGFAAADARAAAAVAAGAARAAAQLVAVNLATREGDPRLVAVRRAVARADGALAGA